MISALFFIRDSESGVISGEKRRTVPVPGRKGYLVLAFYVGFTRACLHSHKA
jgi:hypothetical protein